MTDNEIIKALECHSNDYSFCMECPFSQKGECSCELARNALDLINRQKAEIENLKDILYDADGVNLVNYWHQQCKIAENGCRNFEKENENLKAEIDDLKRDTIPKLQASLMRANKYGLQADEANKLFKEEIKRLQRLADFDRNFIDELNKGIAEAKAEAVKEFAERYERYLLSQLTSAPLDKKEWINFCLEELDNLKNEMVGEG